MSESPGLHPGTGDGSAGAAAVRYRFADGLRGIAASWVVLYHASEGRHLELLRASLPTGVNVVAFDWGWLGVPVFFVLSGFVVAHSLEGRDIDWRGGKTFMLRRILRLTPPFYLSIAFVLAMAVVSAAVRGKVLELPSLASVGAHLLYLQDVLSLVPLNPVYWTLALEMQFYLLFCLLLGCGRGLQRRFGCPRALPFIAAALLASLWPLGVVASGGWPGSFLPTWHGFLLGVFAFWCHRGRLHRGWFFAYAALLLAPSTFNGGLYTVSCVMTALLLYGSVTTRHMAGWLDWRWLQFLGLVSYSLYLTHNPVTGAAFFIGYRLLGRSLFTEAVCLVAVFLCCVLFAWAFHRLIERPSMGWSKNVGRADTNRPALSPA